MRLTVKSEYALLALIDLARRDSHEPSSAREVAERQGIPLRFLEQLFAALRRAGIVRAVRGSRGGFALEREASAVHVLEIVEAVEGPLRSTVCDGGRQVTCARSDACAAGALWDRASRALREVFEDTTLADLVTAQNALEDGSTRRA